MDDPPCEEDEEVSITEIQGKGDEDDVDDSVLDKN